MLVPFSGSFDERARVERRGRKSELESLARFGMTEVPERVIEVVHLEHGRPVSVHTLSAARERKGVWATLAFLAGGTTLGIVLSVLGAHAIDKLVYLPAFVGVWGTLFLALAWFAVPRVRGRLGRYTIGASLENDAFSQVSNGLTLIRRRAGRFELTVLPGMHGHIENGRLPIPIETLLEGPSCTVNLDEGSVADVTLGPSQFVIRSRKSPASASVAAAAIPSDWMRPFARIAVLVFQGGLVASLFCLGPRGRPIDDRMAIHMNLKTATPWEAEKWLRVEAQLQAPSLYACFERMPLACQRPGYVGIGVSLSGDGEIRSHWIARSTYDAECPVESCMSDIVSTWAFDPLPQAMRVILPVQVLRTDKPLVLVQPVHGRVESCPWRGESETASSQAQFELGFEAAVHAGGEGIATAGQSWSALVGSR
jgi:hypothetical protein